MRQNQGLDRVGRHGPRVTHRNIDRRRERGPGALEIDKQPVAFNVDGASQSAWLVESLHLNPVAVDAVRHVGNRPAHRAFRLLDDRVGQRLEAVETIFVHEFEHVPAANLGGGDIRHQVADDLLADPYVHANQFDQFGVQFACLDHLANWNLQAFFIHIELDRRKSAAPDVGQMADAERITDDAAITKGGPHHIEIPQVAGPHPYVVRQYDVAWLE